MILPKLLVEGKDDLYTIAELLQRHSVDMSEPNRPLKIDTARDPRNGAEGVTPLLATMADAIRSATDQPIGFVLDVDEPIDDRWQAVKARLVEAGLTPPASCPPDGYIDRLEEYPHRVGVWMMPDCVSDFGTLEHLIHTLVPSGDPTWPHAVESTGRAKTLGAKFRDVDQNKASLHCWLAWQSTPGLPYGAAISARFLSHDSNEAVRFLRWLKSLFSLDQLRVP